MKLKGILLLCLTATLFCSCSTNKSQKSGDDVSTDSTQDLSNEQDRLLGNIKQYCDSIIMVMPVSGSIEKSKVSPQKLLSPKEVNNVLTLEGKYRMLIMLLTDRVVAQNYNIPTAAYDAACKKLMSDINDPALEYLYKAREKFKKDTPDSKKKEILSESLQKYYDLECQNGRETYFWHIVTAGLVEQLYLTSQSLNTYIDNLDDDSASDFSRYVSTIINDLKKMNEFDDNINQVVKALDPLSRINATSRAELLQQLQVMRKDIDKSRNILIE